MLSLRAPIRPSPVPPSPCYSFRISTSSQTHQVPHSVDKEECSHLLPWLKQKTGAIISSQLTTGKSVYGRSLFASKPIQAGDCILKIPKSVHFTADNLYPQVSSLLEEEDEHVKLILAVLLHQKLGQASEWAPYISCLPRVEEMHCPLLWSDEELEMIKTTLYYEATLWCKDDIGKTYLSIKHVLDRFPEYFEDVTLQKFMHACNLVDSRDWRVGRGYLMIPFADLFNHDIDSDTCFLYNDFEQAFKFIAGKSYAPGDEVFIRYRDFTDTQPLFPYGFMLPFSQCDKVIVVMTVPKHDHLRAMKLNLLGSKNWFSVKNLESSSVEGRGILPGARAVARVVCCTSPQELQQLAMEAKEDDGYVARYPLKNKAREMEAHRTLYLRFDDMIENHSAALESLTCAASPTLSARRMQLARDILTNHLQILRSASAWLKNYCETLKV